jgi:dapdiamide synthase
MPTLTQKDHVVVVDAYSGGKNLIPSFQARGYPVIHVRSGEVPALFVADGELARQRADRHLEFDGDLDELVGILREASPVVVVPGSEGGVLLADRLSTLLGLSFRNEWELSPARRNKFLMQERLRERGLRCIAHAKVEGEATLDAWLAAHSQWPVVLKPLESAATQGVAVCNSREEAHAALRSILTGRDFFGNANEAAVCQEFLVGHEYVINGVACRGHYFFTEGWRSDKVENAGSPVYGTQYLFYYGDDEFETISEYAADACRALGITNGAFHAEVMLTADGPVLIEMGARVAGSADPYFIETCLGHSQVSLLTLAALQPEEYLRLVQTKPVAEGFKRAAYVFLIATSDALVGPVSLEEFLRIEGVVRVDYRYSSGDHQVVTRDLLTSPGAVIVVADDAERLEATVREVRRVERALYEGFVSEPVEATTRSG